MVFPFALSCYCVRGGLWAGRAGRDEADAYEWLQVNSLQPSQGFPTQDCPSPSQPCCIFHTPVLPVCSLASAVSSWMGLAANRVFFCKDAPLLPSWGFSRFRVQPCQEVNQPSLEPAPGRGRKEGGTRRGTYGSAEGETQDCSPLIQALRV